MKIKIILSQYLFLKDQKVNKPSPSCVVEGPTGANMIKNNCRNNANLQLLRLCPSDQQVVWLHFKDTFFFKSLNFCLQSCILGCAHYFVVSARPRVMI